MPCYSGFMRQFGAGLLSRLTNTAIADMAFSAVIAAFAVAALIFGFGLPALKPGFLG
ncbi:hypothetical protein [Bradyrhizobium embrapense]|uniref:hypothetical protein n=1 Tax=Bradyrhizobium embrapense TaxID=630921 RepID=UPI0012F49082|nr:hypothetical protein [Bradyrhizobium embrapense]